MMTGLKTTTPNGKAIDSEVEKFAQKTLVYRRLQAAWEYALWLDENGAGSSYSTFCDDFGYEGAENEDRPATYEVVMSLIDAAREAQYR